MHLLLPAVPGARLAARSTALAIASLAWSAAVGQIAGIVLGVASAPGGAAWLVAGARPRPPITTAGRKILVSAFTHYRRGGVPDMAGHATARATVL